MTKDLQKMEKETISCLEIRQKIGEKRGSGSGIRSRKILDPDSVCTERLDPDPVNI